MQIHKAYWKTGRNPEFCSQTYLVVSVQHVKHMSDLHSSGNCWGAMLAWDSFPVITLHITIF